MHTLEEVNNLIVANSMSSESPQRISPELGNESLHKVSKSMILVGNVCFSSGQHGWSFTLTSFATLYATKHSQVITEVITQSIHSLCYTGESHDSSQEIVGRLVLQPGDEYVYSQ